MKGITPAADGWTVDGEKITEIEKLEAIRVAINKRGPIILEHKFYRGGRSPQNLILEEYETFVEYLDTKARAGDRMTIWMFCDVCRTNNATATGKYPDDEGRVPLRGAY